MLAGRQHVFGYEQQSIPALPDSLPAGAKVRSTLLRAWGSVQRMRANSEHEARAPPQVTLTDTPVRRGVLLLCPENVVVLGGQARSLLASVPCPRSYAGYYISRSKPDRCLLGTRSSAWRPRGSRQ